jgi:hypothetical protein
MGVASQFRQPGVGPGEVEPTFLQALEDQLGLTLKANARCRDDPHCGSYRSAFGQLMPVLAAPFAGLRL